MERNIGISFRFFFILLKGALSVKLYFLMGLKYILK